MQQWSLDAFENNNRKLNNYLRNVENAIVLLCANDSNAVEQLRDMMQEKFAFECINYKNENIPFSALLDMYTCGMQHRLCFYNMTEEGTNYDLIKTINLSRDILRKVGIVVFIVPAYIAERIQLENPNLYDYITLCLNYNISYKNHLKPIYSEENRYFVPKEVRTARKAMAIANMPSKIQSVSDYYQYLESCQYANISAKSVNQMITWLFDYMHENFEAMNYMNQNEENYNEVRINLYMKTASVLQQQRYYNQAIELYDEILYLKKQENEIGMSELEAMQGKAFCYYRMQSFEQAEAMLELLINKVRTLDNPAWYYKIYSDLGVCYLNQGQTGKAKTVWEKCALGLRENKEYNTYRHCRILYNIMMTCLADNVSIKKYEQEWSLLGDEISENIGEDGLVYLDYMLMSSWLLLQKGKLEPARQCAVRTRQVGDVILPENDEKKIITDYILALIMLQQGADGEYMYFLKRCRNLLKSHNELLWEYQDLMV